MIKRRHAAFVRLSRLLWTLLLWGSFVLAKDGFELDAKPYIVDLPEELPESKAEVQVILPPWPRDADLIAFVPGGTATPYRFFIDGTHLRVDPSGSEVHYTLIIETANGLRNVSYEGIRCDLNGAFKTFAYGSDGRFVKSTAADWAPLSALGNGAYRVELYRHHFCVQRDTRARPLKDILRGLRGGESTNYAPVFQAQ
jgi:hypothetical protein